MSGRPANFKQWAVGSYPPGTLPWSSHPEQSPPFASPLRATSMGSAGFVPSQAGTAQELNSAIGRVSDNNAALLSLMGQSAAMNWRMLNVSTPTPNLLTPSFDPKWGRWFVAGYDTAHNGFCVSETGDGGSTWSGSGQQPASPTIATGFVACVIPNNAGQVAVAAYAGSGAPGAVTDEVTRYSIVSPTGHMIGCFFGGKYVLVGYDNATTLLGISTGGAWTTTAGSPTPAWTTAAAAAFFFYVSQSSTKAIFVARGATTTDQVIAFDGNNFSYLGQIGLAAGWIITGLAFDGTNFLVSTTNGTDSRIYYSTDGANWFTGSVTSSGLASGIVYEGIAALGALIFLVATDSRRGTHGQYSVDSGQTFQAGSSFRTTASGPFRVVSGKYNFAVLSGGVISFSEWMGA